MRRVPFVAVVVVMGLLALAALPVGFAQPILGLTAQYLPVVVKSGASPTPLPGSTATRSPTLTATATVTPTLTGTVTLTRTPSVTPSITNTPPPTNTATPTATRNPALCAAEYPTVCIPPPPPDLNCNDIPYHDFTVLPPDRHHFDGNNDGIGCEAN